MRRHERGFTIVELLIVVAVLGILATIAVPAMRHHYRSALVRSAGPQILTQVLGAQERYRAEKGVYVSDVADLAAYGIKYSSGTQWPIPNSAANNYYTISFPGGSTGGSSTEFKVQAQGTITGGSGNDTWTIDQDGKLVHVDDGS